MQSEVITGDTGEQLYALKKKPTPVSGFMQ